MTCPAGVSIWNSAQRQFKEMNRLRQQGPIKISV
jgi:hypothetical protein